MGVFAWVSVLIHACIMYVHKLEGVVYVYVYTCACTYYVCLGVCMNTCMCTVVYSCEFMCLVVYYSVSDLLGRSELGNGRFEFVPILNPIP